MTPVIHDAATGRPIGLVAHLLDGRWKARALHGWSVWVPMYFPTREDAERWVRSVAGGLWMEVVR